MNGHKRRMLKRCHSYPACNSMSKNSEPITNVNPFNALAEIDKDKEKMSAEKKVIEMQDRKEVQRLKD